MLIKISTLVLRRMKIISEKSNIISSQYFSFERNNYKFVVYIDEFFKTFHIEKKVFHLWDLLQNIS
jgi:hypothetical protein